MRLNEITIPMVQQAIDLYLENAYPGDPPAHPQNLRYTDAGSAADLIDQFDDESHYTENELSHRYILRLGNRSYPHMKLVLEEYLVREEFFFTVDSHDGMVKLKSTSPDYDAWQQLRIHNAEVKATIETAWQAANLPTYRDLRGLMAEQTEAQKKGRGKILIVDDERDVADTTQTLLKAHGFEVDIAYNGYEALEKIAENKPDIVLQDIMMPGMDGYEVCSKIKRNEQTKDVAVLLVTAGTGEMIATREADGFLAKPFKQDILLTFINHLLNPPPLEAEDI